MFEHLKRWLSEWGRRPTPRGPDGPEGERSAEGAGPEPHRPSDPGSGQKAVRNRHGIRVIDPDAEFADLMPAEDGDAGSAVPAPRPDRPKPAPRRTVPPRTPATNRHGIRIIDPGVSLEQAMAAARPAADRGPAAGNRTGDPGPGQEGANPPRKDRHGIPRLDPGVDLRRLFDAAHGETPTGSEAFANLLERSLALETEASVHRKKREGAPGPRPMTLARRLKRYPPPEDTLDLHGFRASEAASRSRAFLRSRRDAGTLTVLIVVGRGLHSEEGPVLPDVVETVLRELKQEGTVLAYRREGRSRRKSGAVVVFLQGQGAGRRP